MSKIGRMPITIPQGVTLTLEGKSLKVAGNLGSMEHILPHGIKGEIKDGVLTLSRSSDSKTHKALHGLTRALVANMVTGVSTGFKKDLELIGTGYRVRSAGNKIILSLGFSHEVEYEAPAGIKLVVEGTNLIHITGFDKQAVGHTAAVIRDYKKPEPYKGKGIRYVGESVRRKAGKAAKAGA